MCRRWSRSARRRGTGSLNGERNVWSLREQSPRVVLVNRPKSPRLARNVKAARHERDERERRLNSRLQPGRLASSASHSVHISKASLDRQVVASHSRQHGDGDSHIRVEGNDARARVHDARLHHLIRCAQSAQKPITVLTWSWRRRN
jgi:hypothetical protein